MFGERPPLSQRLGAGISYSVLTVIASVVNVLVLLGLYCYRKTFSKYPFYTLASHLIIASLGELVGQVVVAIPLSFAGLPLYGDDTTLIVLSSLDTFFFLAMFFMSLCIALNRCFAVLCSRLYAFFFMDFRLHLTCAFVWIVSAIWLIVTTVIGCPKIFRHDGFYYRYRCNHPHPDAVDIVMHISKHISYTFPALMLIIYALVFWKVRRVISYRSSDGYILIQSVLICVVFELEAVLFAILPQLETRIGLFWLSLILDYMLILTSCMSAIILLCLNPRVKTAVNSFLRCSSPGNLMASHENTDYQVYDVSDDYGARIKEEKQRRKLERLRACDV